MGDESSKPKTECRKIKLHSKSHAERIAEKKAKEWGKPTRVYPCDICSALHISTKPGNTKLNSKNSGRPTAVKTRNAPETMRMQRLRYKRRKQLPLEVWENEGGALHSSE